MFTSVASIHAALAVSVSNDFRVMRTVTIALVIVVIGLVVATRVGDWLRIDLPQVGPSVEQVCGDAMQRPPDLSWIAPGRAEKIRGRGITDATHGELPGLDGSLVRVAGVLHAEFEWVALYPSRAAMAERPWQSPWVALNSLWRDEPYWQTKGPSISDRCVVVEGTYWDDRGGHFGMFRGTIGDVLRLDVWSTPHRPFVTTVPPPPPPPPPAPLPCAARPSPPRQLSQSSAGELAEFNKLFETGEYQLGYCVASVQVSETGTVDAVRVVRPRRVDAQVDSAIVRALKSRRYAPAVACGRPVPFTVSVGVFHCPTRPESGR